MNNSGISGVVSRIVPFFMEEKKLTNGKTKKVILKAIPGTRGILLNIAAKCGLDRRTITRYVNEYEEVREAIQDERERLVDTAENNLSIALRDKEKWATIYTLKTLGKNRGYTERQEVENSGEITINVTYGDTD